MRTFLAAAAAVLVACACPAPSTPMSPTGDIRPAPSSTPIATVGPPPSCPPARLITVYLQPTQAPSAWPSAHLNPWTWEPNIDTPQLQAVLAGFHVPEDVAAWLFANTDWRDDYDITVWLSPARLVAERRGVCSAYARFWARALQGLGFAPVIESVDHPGIAHAVVLFKAGPSWRIASNQSLLPDLAPVDTSLRTALVLAAERIFPGSWRELDQVDVTTGAIVAGILQRGADAPVPTR